MSGGLQPKAKEMLPRPAILRNVRRFILTKVSVKKPALPQVALDVDLGMVLEWFL